MKRVQTMNPCSKMNELHAVLMSYWSKEVLTCTKKLTFMRCGAAIWLTGITIQGSFFPSPVW